MNALGPSTGSLSPAPSGRRKVSLLLLTSNQMSEQEIEYAENFIRSSFGEKLNLEAVVTRSDRWWFQTFAQCGDWETWIVETVSGRPYGEIGFHFNGFVLSYPIIGRANAAIMKRAMDRGAPIFDVTRSELQVVNQINEIDPNNWKSGWSVQSSPILEKS